MKAKSHKKALLFWFLLIPVIAPILTFVILNGIRLSFFDLSPLSIPLGADFVSGVLQLEIRFLAAAAVLALGIALGSRLSAKLAMILTLPAALQAAKMLTDNLMHYSEPVYKILNSKDIMIFALRIPGPDAAPLLDFNGFLLEFIDYQQITMFLVMAVIAWSLVTIYHGLAWLHYSEFPEPEAPALPTTK